ncbi:MAG: HesA/MoeB/ThiF family protein, partial [Pseudomonadota bacterium]
LALAGIGAITVNDFDRIDASNLARQSLYRSSDIGQPKTLVAQRALRQLRPALPITAIDARLTDSQLKEVATRAAVILDCTDNFISRFAINQAAVAAGTPLVSGSAIRWEGQVAVFGPDYASGPCYECLYSIDDESLEDCAGAGVLASVPAIIGHMMATEAIKCITGAGSASALSLYDAHDGRWQQVQIAQRSDCSMCGPTVKEHNL